MFQLYINGECLGALAKANYRVLSGIMNTKVKMLRTWKLDDALDPRMDGLAGINLSRLC